MKKGVHRPDGDSRRRPRWAREAPAVARRPQDAITTTVTPAGGQRDPRPAKPGPTRRSVLAAVFAPEFGDDPRAATRTVGGNHASAATLASHGERARTRTGSSPRSRLHLRCNGSQHGPDQWGHEEKVIGRLEKNQAGNRGRGDEQQQCSCDWMRRSRPRCAGHVARATRCPAGMDAIQRAADLSGTGFAQSVAASGNLLRYAESVSGVDLDPLGTARSNSSRKQRLPLVRIPPALEISPDVWSEASGLQRTYALQTNSPTEAATATAMPAPSLSALSLSEWWRDARSDVARQDPSGWPWLAVS